MKLTYSDTHCESDTTDEYGYDGDCWTTYYTYYTFEFFNQTLETNSTLNSVFHKTLYFEIKFSIYPLNGVIGINNTTNEVNS